MAATPADIKKGKLLMSDIFLGKSNLIKYAFILVKSVIVLLCYLYLDKKHNTKRTVAEYIGIFVFCDLYVIYDVIKKLKSKSVTSSKNLIIILTILLIFNFLSNSFISFYNRFNDVLTTGSKTETVYYDRYGIEYSSLEDVVYYTFDGAEFKYDPDRAKYDCIVDTPDNKYDSSYDDFFVYIDKDGWIVFTDSLLEYSDGNGDYGFYDEDSQNYYGNIRAIRWNENGTVYWDY